MSELDDLFGSASDRSPEIPNLCLDTKLTIDQIGIYRISNEDYHADPCILPSLSRGTIRDLITKTPAHVFARNKRLNPAYVEEEQEDKFDIGTFAHALFLEGHDNAAVFQHKDWKKPEAQQDRKGARAAGKIPFLQHQYDVCCDMVEAAKQQLAMSELGITNLLKEGKSEESFFWKEDLEKTDICGKPTGEVEFETWCRCRTDWRSNDFTLCLDYKTTTDADPESFSRKITDMGYDIQQVFYKRGMRKAANLEKNPRFVFMVQEVKPPYLCSFIGLPPEFAAMGKEKMEYGFYMWQKCLATGEWPGYPARICYVEPKPWALASWELRASGIGEE